MQPFETSRLILRGPRMTDLRPLTEMWTDAAVAQFMDDYGPREPAGVQEWLTQVVRATEHSPRSSPSSVQLTLVRKQDRTVVGAVDACHRRFGITSFWGECHRTNTASARVMTAAGFSEIAPGDDGNRRFVIEVR